MNKTPNQSEKSFPKRIFSLLHSKNNIVLKILSVLLALLAWEFSALLINNLLFPTPIQVVKSLFSLLSEKEFYSTLCNTLWHINLGFLAGFALGFALALPASRFKIVEYLLWPYMVTVKSIPVASFAAIAFIFISAENISVLIAFLMSFPIIYTNLFQGIKSVDKKILQMAEVFKIPYTRRLKYIWLPNVKSFLQSGTKIAISLSFKAGIAAELIGYPRNTIGAELYNAKQFFETADLFAWTIVIVLLAYVTEKLFLYILKLLIKGAEK